MVMRWSCKGLMQSEIAQDSGKEIQHFSIFLVWSHDLGEIARLRPRLDIVHNVDP